MVTSAGYGLWDTHLAIDKLCAAHILFINEACCPSQKMFRLAGKIAE